MDLNQPVFLRLQIDTIRIEAMNLMCHTFLEIGDLKR